MKKRIISIALIIIMAIGFVPTVASALTEGAFIYTVSQNRAVITSFNRNYVGAVTIPQTLGGYPVYEISESAFLACEGITEILIPDCVEQIDGRAFYECINLKKITVDENNKNFVAIGGVLYKADKTEIVCCPKTFEGIFTVPEGVKTIGKYAFNSCTSLSDIIFPSTIKYLNERAFENCTALKTLVIPNVTTTIYSYTFNHCTNLNNVIIEGDTSLGECAFADCTKLQKFTVYGNVRIIDESAFLFCSSLGKVHIGGNLNNIYPAAFSRCQNLTEFYVNGVIGTIGDYAFRYCTNLSKISIEKCNRRIVKGAFVGCTSLKRVAINPEISTIEENIFLDSGIKEIFIPNSIAMIYEGAFSGCNSLTHVYFSGTQADCETIYIDGDNDKFKNATWVCNSTCIEGHFYDSACDNTCNVCNQTRQANHNFTDANSRYSHYQECTLCGIVTDITNHTFGDYVSNNDATTESDGTKTRYCLYCDANETVTDVGSKLHTHSYTNACDTTCNGCDFTREITHSRKATFDVNNHFDKCTVCGDTINVKAHAFDNACDNDCDCGFVRTTNHAFGEYVYNNDASEKADGTKTRTCSVCGHKETVTATGTKWKSSFTDIKTKDFYYKPTLWAVANGITTGTSKTEFSPEEPCTRGQVVTFLWRAAGCPEPKSTTMPFTDVGGKAFYKKAVLWAVEQGITSGTSATTFSPNETCTRGQIATFLWRAKGKPAPESSNMPFVDVAAKNFAYKAVLWAVENKITSGTSKTTFEPSEPCTRGQIVTFLYRAYK